MAKIIDIEEENNKKVRCFLVGEPGNDLIELEGLTKTLDLETVGKLILTRLEITPTYGMGKGKAQEICEQADECDADCIIFDFDIDPTKQRNWEKLSKLPCFDRQEVIIRIFAKRAQTREAVLQVELARLSYSLPRLAHSYGDMARQRGGSYGSKGSGETQLELDRRRVLEKINQTKKELENVVRTRQTQRKKRESIPVPQCALIGYTNAGKSSLLNALTGSNTFVEDKLFATLDPLTRKIKLKDGNGILLTDTVGFISNLPHTLIDAFKSTLDEAKNCNLLLIVLDCSDEKINFEFETVCSVLKDIGADENQQLIVLNKWDKIQDDEILCTSLKAKFPEAVCVSAKTEYGFNELSNEISKKLLGQSKTFSIPLEKAHLAQEIRMNGIIINEKWLNDRIELTARVKGKTFEKARIFLKNG